VKKAARPKAEKPVRDKARSSAGPVFVPNRGPILAMGMRGTYTQLGYHAVRVASRDGRWAVPGSGDFHLLFNRDQLANQAREFGRDNGIFQGMIDRAVGYIVGSGFTLQCRTEDAKWNAQAEEHFRTVHAFPEISGLLSWHQFQKLLGKELLSLGDVGVLKTVDGKIQLIESEQIAGPTMKNDGLQRDANGTVTGFYVAPYTGGGTVDYARARLVRAEDFMYLLNADRPSSKRGVPPLQSVFSMLHRINDACDAEAKAMQLLARFAIGIEKMGAGQTGLSTSIADPSKTGATGNLADRLSDTDVGIAVFLEPGETVKGIDHNIPGKDFPQSLTMFMRLLGLPLGLPLEFILLDWTKSNYSQSRAVLEQAYQSFIYWQQVLEQRFYKPYWRHCVDLAVADRSDDGLPPREDMYLHEWIKPTFPWIDQLQEAQAKGAMVDRGFTTHSQVLKSLNWDREEWMKSRKAEIVSASKVVDEIKAETGKDVPLEHFCGLQFSVNKPQAEKPKAKEDTSSDAAEEVEERAQAPIPDHTITEVTERDDKGRVKTFITRNKFKKEGA
jgi:capsid protein